MTDYFVMAEGDRLPILTGTAKAGGVVVNINGAAVTVRIWDWNKERLVFSAAAENLDDGTTATRGDVRYQWTGAEGLKPGNYKYGWFVLFGDGRGLSFPNDPLSTFSISPRPTA